MVGYNMAIGTEDKLIGGLRFFVYTRKLQGRKQPVKVLSRWVLITVSGKYLFKYTYSHRYTQLKVKIYGIAS